MKYQVGEVGKVVVARFEDGDAILENLSAIAKRENIRASVFYLVGGITDAHIVVGAAADEARPPEPVWREIAESHEALGIGTIFWQGDEPKIHLHGTYGKLDTVRTGCLRNKGTTFLILEAIIFEIKGVDAVRDLDSLTNMVLLKLP